MVTALRDRQLGPVSTYCEDVAERRFAAGFGISEVQTAFNALEVAMWRRLVAGVPPQGLAEAVGLLSTILGFGKDALARRYVSLASERHVPTLDLSALFAGTERCRGLAAQRRDACGRGGKRLSSPAPRT